MVDNSQLNSDCVYLCSFSTVLLIMISDVQIGY